MGHAVDTQFISLENPTLLAATDLRDWLNAELFHISGRTLTRRDSGLRGFVLDSIYSPPLSVIVRRMNKESDNLYAECLFRTVAKVIGGEGSWTRGIEVMRKYLASIGTDTTQIQFTDGSGLSRMDLVTADDIVKLLAYWYPGEGAGTAPLQSAKEAFYNSLPIMGVDGTLENRLKDTPAQGNVHAKTGSMTGVRSISGYLTTRDDEPIVFSILANNYTCPGSDIGNLVDEVLLRLVDFSRK